MDLNIFQKIILKKYIYGDIFNKLSGKLQYVSTYKCIAVTRPRLLQYESKMF